MDDLREIIDQCRDVTGDLLIKTGQLIKPKRHKKGKVDHVEKGGYSPNSPEKTMVQNESMYDGFDLSQLQSLYERFGIDIKYNQSFVFLLNMVRKHTYTSMVRIVDERTQTVEDLIRIVNGPIPVVDSEYSNFNFDIASGGPFISKEQIYSICKEEGVEPLESIDEMVKMLIVHKEEEGKKLFSSVFGFKFAQIKRKYEQGIDVGDDFETIKKRLVQEIK